MLNHQGTNILHGKVEVHRLCYLYTLPISLIIWLASPVTFLHKINPYLRYTLRLFYSIFSSLGESFFSSLPIQSSFIYIYRCPSPPRIRMENQFFLGVTLLSTPPLLTIDLECCIPILFVTYKKVSSLDTLFCLLYRWGLCLLYFRYFNPILLPFIETCFSLFRFRWEFSSSILNSI